MYKVIWLKEWQELATFKGEIISIIDKKFESGGYIHDLYRYEGYWTFQCLVKINSEEELINEKEDQLWLS